MLARKYRPTDFSDLIGQEVLVRTLKNAFATGRIAHAFMLTGIRGIGKTTTARIIARGLNCTGADGNGGPTTSPCGVCSNCKMLADDRHVDVIEMDAASRTGVDDIREIIDSVPYAPVTGRYKIYIIDEVHMLSKNAFNALLKTLEEPPPYVKFIFATTEIRKIPVTIISRCQRFDLKRVETDTLAKHLQDIANRENIVLNDASARLIAVAAEGSVRDALSVLDRAISMHTDEAGNTEITADSLRDMLGLADRSQSFALLKSVLEGKADIALKFSANMHENGAESLQILHDLIDITHYVSRVSAAPDLLRDIHYASSEQDLAKEMATAFSIPHLARIWQILLKGLDEMRQATKPQATLEMLLIRMAYAANLPTPAQLIKKLQNAPAVNAMATASNASASNGEIHAHTNAYMPTTAGNPAPAAPTALNNVMPISARTAQTAATAQSLQAQPAAFHQNTALALKPETAEESPEEIIENFEQMVALFAKYKEPVLHAHLTHDLRPAAFEQGQITLQPVSYISPDIMARIQRRLKEWTGASWHINLVNEGGGATLAEIAKRQKQQALEYAKNHPRIQEIAHIFEGVEVMDFIPANEE